MDTRKKKKVHVEWNSERSTPRALVMNALAVTLKVRKTINSLHIHLDEVYLVTAFVPSETACFASSPGSNRRTAVCTSRLVIVDRLL